MKFLQSASFSVLKHYSRILQNGKNSHASSGSGVFPWLQGSIGRKYLRVKELFNSLGVSYNALELDQMDNGISIQNGLEQRTGQRTVPNIFINGQHVGGCDDTLALHRDNKLTEKLQVPTYDYDLVVVGGGSGGLAASKEAAKFGMKVACLDYVSPSPRGSTWGLGGTCVNVGCIPKKLMHQAAILGHNLEDAKKFGWEFSEDVKHNWISLKDAVQDHIGSLNWGYRVQLRDKNVTYMNAYGEFVGPHTLKTTNKRGKVKEITSSKFLIATGMRPRYPDVKGASDYAISSDDLFSLPYAPGKTLVVGASYVSLECAGFLKKLGFDTTVMVRSILLRGFDQDMAERIGDHMINEGIKFVRPCVPTKIERLQEGEPGLYKVTAKMQDGTEVVNEYNTIMFAVGRDPCTQNLGLDKVGVNVAKNGFISVNDCEQTNVPHIYAVGDVCADLPELTPVAIHAGRLLARRLYNSATEKTDYVNVPTTVFTPIEYGAIGLSEEDAIKKYSFEDIEVYHQHFWPLEHTIPKRPENECYAKLICVKSLDEKVVGLHVLGPNAGEITQGFALGFRLGAKKSDYDSIIGIHPTCAETFTTLNVTKGSGDDITTAGC